MSSTVYYINKLQCHQLLRIVDSSILARFLPICPFCSSSVDSLPQAHALQLDPSVFWRDRITDCPC